MYLNYVIINHNTASLSSSRKFLMSMAFTNQHADSIPEITRVQPEYANFSRWPHYLQNWIHLINKSHKGKLSPNISCQRYDTCGRSEGLGSARIAGLAFSIETTSNHQATRPTRTHSSSFRRILLLITTRIHN